MLPLISLKLNTVFYKELPTSKSYESTNVHIYLPNNVLTDKHVIEKYRTNYDVLTATNSSPSSAMYHPISLAVWNFCSM
jgi:hypothetical protein